MFLRLLTFRYSSPVKITGGRRVRVSVSDPLRATFLTTNRFAPLTRVITAMTEATPMITPRMVRMVRILLAQSDWSATLIASPNCIIRGPPSPGDRARVGCRGTLGLVYAETGQNVPFCDP